MAEVQHSPPSYHKPGDVTKRPKGILKNPSFSGPSGPQLTQGKDGVENIPTTSPLFDPQNSVEATLQNTLQNAGHRRSSSAARRASAVRRHSSGMGINLDDDPNMRLKWDEANLYLAEQDRGTRMKITEPKTPYQYGDSGAMQEDDVDEDVSIDPRYVNVDEVEMARAKKYGAHRESSIPNLELGEPEDPTTGSALLDDSDRIVRTTTMSREGSKEKHVSVSSGSGQGMDGLAEEPVGMPTKEEAEKHRKFEEQRKRHYEMRDVKSMLGHPDEIEEMDEDDEMISPSTSTSKQTTTLPDRGINGAR